MKTSSFSFDLPDHLVAQAPPDVRGSSRLMVVSRNSDSGFVRHETVQNLPDLIPPDTLMVFNDTKVRKARLFAVNPDTGGRGEFLFLKQISTSEWDCLVDRAKKKRTGQKWVFPDDVTGRIIRESAENRKILRFDLPLPEEWFERHGHMPLPPYIRRPDGPNDSRSYQTVYAREIGSAAAPTAGLHFTAEILDALKDRGIRLAWISLKVGPGTFAPIRSETVPGHTMHTEEYNVPQESALAVNNAKAEGRMILAVGTTSVRTLESAWNGEGIETGHGTTDIFIYPGYRFNIVDSMFTNFHTPRSSLLVLVSAFAGRERILEAYRRAVEEEYRFFSYGDAMLIV